MDLERRRDRERYARRMEYASPAGMIVEATAARLAGDWRAACAAAAVDVHVDLRAVAVRFGAEAAAAIEADLAGLAPDFLRRHLPRDDSDALHPGVRAVFSTATEPFRRDTPVLVVTLPTTETAAQRLGLRVVAAGDLGGTWLDLPAWAWHAGAVAERRAAYGASAERLPWHSADGTPYAQGAPQECDFERLLAVTEPDRIADLYRTAGLVVDSGKQGEWFLLRLGLLQDRLPLIAAEARRLIDRYRALLPGREDGGVLLPSVAWQTLDLRVHDDGSMSVTWDGSWTRTATGPSAFGIGAPRDVALLRWGALTADQFHPLVHEALFPGRAQDWQPITHEPYGAYRVRCGGNWHVVEGIGASVETPHHSVAELRREDLLGVLGGRVSGCAAAAESFRRGTKPVPKEIRKHRQRLFGRAFHGDTDGLLADLEAGFDPRLRDGLGRSLMHWVAYVDHARVLPVLLAGGLSVDLQDRDGRTPLHVAAQSGAEDAMAALLAAGARAGMQDAEGRTARDVLALSRKRAAR